MKLQTILTSGLLGVSALASAQQTNEQYFQEQQQRQQQAFHAEEQRRGYEASQDQQQQPQQPSGYWEKTWGAIATSEAGGALGTAVGASGESTAKQWALSDCSAKGGAGCRVDLVYENQCAAMLLGDGFLRLYSAGSVEKATANGMDECQKQSRNCRVYYSACTEPKWHQY